ncbi:MULTISPECIES: hypothetical protein [Metabacillus]|jgi:hypothetical protein|uniref:Uncharacterized protein n=1 Tax=Metabacillus hrfriensis TaxID=3048891 RepID=A0ACD4R7M5_9BACI|nr:MULTISPECIES: hypothetical protein [Metabacillus]WHZ56419.1 hypothetical protein QLQ22_17175 [Metabacillus sp. CT-WN-B3]
MSQEKSSKSQKGKPNADTVKKTMAFEEMEKAVHPTKRQNSEQ